MKHLLTTMHQPLAKVFPQHFTAQDLLYRMLKSIIPPRCQWQVLGWDVWKSPEMWGMCSPFSQLILWNFSSRLKKMCLKHDRQPGCVGAAHRRGTCLSGKVGVGTPVVLRFYCISESLGGPTSRVLIHGSWRPGWSQDCGKRWEFSCQISGRCCCCWSGTTLGESQPYSILSEPLGRRPVASWEQHAGVGSSTPLGTICSDSYFALAGFLTICRPQQSLPSPGYGFPPPLPEHLSFSSPSPHPPPILWSSYHIPLSTKTTQTSSHPPFSLLFFSSSQFCALQQVSLVFGLIRGFFPLQLDCKLLVGRASAQRKS